MNDLVLTILALLIGGAGVWVGTGPHKPRERKWWD